MNLIPEWKKVGVRLWSIRLALFSAALSAVEVALPLLDASMPRGVFAGLSASVAFAAAVARLVAQPKLHE